MVSAAGDLDGSAALSLQRALDDAAGAQALMIDLHDVAALDRDGLLHLLDLHRRGNVWACGSSSSAGSPSPSNSSPKSPASPDPVPPPKGATR
ncbi:hypothetical protein AB0D54_24155 [Streptomyces xanthophaeus]|uniref:hypothetical protein n=1 Tax=Streptomyces xanthophaeus TaxID=67385 RepID=UPI00344A1F2D